jgi:glutamyl/glutaminyl-tRNA synthetase
MILLVNRDEAAARGGHLIVRFDDAQPYWRFKLGDHAIAALRDGMKEDIEWLGIEPEYHSEVESPVWDDPRVASLYEAPADFSDPKQCYPHVPNVAGEARPFPYAGWLTAAKVIADFEQECDPIIRATDLCDEYALYVHLCKQFGYPVPMHYYIPKLQQSTNLGFAHYVQDVGDVSKSSPTGVQWSIRHFRDAGMKPEKLIERLALVCLRDTSKPWFVSNVVDEPRVCKGAI